MALRMQTNKTIEASELETQDEVQIISANDLDFDPFFSFESIEKTIKDTLESIAENHYPILRDWLVTGSYFTPYCLEDILKDSKAFDEKLEAEDKAIEERLAAESV